MSLLRQREIYRTMTNSPGSLPRRPLHDGVQPAAADRAHHLDPAPRGWRIVAGDVADDEHDAGHGERALAHVAFARVQRVRDAERPRHRQPVVENVGDRHLRAERLRNEGRPEPAGAGAASATVAPRPTRDCPAIHQKKPAPLTPDPAGAGSDRLQLILAIVSTLTALGGWYIAHLMYYAKPELPELLPQKFHGVYRTLLNKYWVDELYEGVIAAPVLFFSRFVLNFLVDRGVIDGAGFTAGATAQGFGSLVSRIQSGNIRSYAGWLAFGAMLVLVVTYFVFTGSFMLH